MKHLQVDTMKTRLDTIDIRQAIPGPTGPPGPAGPMGPEGKPGLKCPKLIASGSSYGDCTGIYVITNHSVSTKHFSKQQLWSTQYCFNK